MVRKTLVVVIAVCTAAVTSHAEVWMVKSSGAIGCRDRDTLVALEAAADPRAPSAPLPEGCLTLFSGERLLDQPEVGVGFNDFMRVTRADGGTVFVRASALVSDPGIGSVTDDRPE